MKILNITLAIILLICLFPMPYGYYNIVRVIAMVSFAWFAYRKYQSKEYILVLLFIVGAILFQPFVKFHLGRTIWNIVDVVYAIVLIASCFSLNRNDNLLDT